MPRHFVVSLLIGGLVSVAVLISSELGGSEWSFNQVRGLYSEIPLIISVELSRESQLLQYAVCIVAAFVVALFSVSLGRLFPKLILAFSVSIVIGLTSLVLALYGVLFEPISGNVSLFLALILGLFYARTEAANRGRVYQQLISGRMSADAARTFLSDPLSFNYRGEKRDIAVMTCAITDEADLCASLPKSQAISLVNEFLKICSKFMLGRGAYVDDLSGEGVRVFFGISTSEEQCVAKACGTALGLREKLEKFQEVTKEKYGESISWGISVVSGELTVGLLSEGKFARFSALGTEIRLARHLCSVGGHYGPAIVASHRVFNDVSDEMEFRPLDRIESSELSDLEDVHELLAEKEGIPPDAVARRDAFSRGVNKFRNEEYTAALMEFGTARPPSGLDRVLERYVAVTKKRLGGGNFNLKNDSILTVSKI